MQRRSNRTSQTPTVETVCTPELIDQLQDAPEWVTVDEDVQTYIADLVRATRSDNRVTAGVSPRGTQRMFEASRAMATVNGRDYVTPDDVKRIAGPVLAHRLVLTPDARVNNIEKTSVVRDIVDSRPVPTVDYDRTTTRRTTPT